jgi:hypothetical protein
MEFHMSTPTIPTPATTEEPWTAREAWLHVALGVAGYGLPHPRNVRIGPRLKGPGSVSLEFETVADMFAWSDWLGHDRSTISNLHGTGPWGVDVHHGWQWSLDGPLHEPGLTQTSAEQEAAVRVMDELGRDVATHDPEAAS